jgi:mono/diheme cytochrome c family protein
MNSVSVPVYTVPMRRLCVLAALIAGVLCSGRPVIAQGPGWTIPESALAEKSPFQSKGDASKKGRSVFASNCQRCHGREGRGDGPEGNPRAKPADLSNPAGAASDADGVLFYKIWNGRIRSSMPAFKSKLTKDDVWAVVEYVRTLQK